MCSMPPEWFILNAMLKFGIDAPYSMIVGDALS